jgi:pyruvate formate-lyase activating enzyme-like uncharacterized protein
MAEEIVFDDPEAYLGYLEKFGFRGVGFSGGEPLLAFDKLLMFLEMIKRRFGREMYVWLYTNGHLVDAAKLRSLRKAGLDEVRFNIHARNYDLGPVELARSLINRLTVEIPAVPEDYEIIRDRLFDLDRIGVDHLNIHQLIASQYNYQDLVERGYTFTPPMAFQEVPVLESEMAALRLVHDAATRKLDMAVNYCSHAYKATFGKLGRRRRAAPLVHTEFERLTAAGYISRLSIRGTPSLLQQVVRALEAEGMEERLWRLDDSGTELCLHHSLLKRVDLEGLELIVRIYEPLITSPGIKGLPKPEATQEIEIGKGKLLVASRKLVAEKSLVGQEIDHYEKVLAEGIRYRETFDRQGLEPNSTVEFQRFQEEAISDLEPLERISLGFPELESSTLF